MADTALKIINEHLESHGFGINNYYKYSIESGISIIANNKYYDLKICDDRVVISELYLRYLNADDKVVNFAASLSDPELLHKIVDYLKNDNKQ